MSQEQKPATVPKEAIWNPSQNEWELGKKNEQGKHIGEWKWWLAPKGHLCCHTIFDDHGVMQSFKRFHPNGEVSRYGTYENGKAIEDVYLKSSEQTTEVFAYGSTDENVYKAVKRSGMPVEFDYYDKEGNHLNAPIESKSLLKEDEAGMSKKEINLIRKTIYTIGKGFLKNQFDNDFYKETIFPIAKEEHQGILNNVAGGSLNNGKDFVFHEGDLHVRNLNCFAEMEVGVLMVVGNLTVDGSIRINDDIMEMILVTGDVVAQNIVTSGMFIVHGNVTVKNVLMGDYNHGSASIGGNLTARFFHPEEYFFEVNGTSTFEYAFGNSWRLNQNTNPEVFNFNGKKLSDLIPLFHENIHDAGCFAENPSLLETACDDYNPLFEYIDRYELMQYISLNKPLFK